MSIRPGSRQHGLTFGEAWIPFIPDGKSPVLAVLRMDWAMGSGKDTERPVLLV